MDHEEENKENSAEENIAMEMMEAEDISSPTPKNEVYMDDEEMKQADED